MSYLEELLPEFRKGARIRRRCWKPECFLFIRDGLICDQEDCVYTSYATSILEDDWELYKDPEPDWNYIIDNKCLCWFWDDDEKAKKIGFLTEYRKYDTLLHYKKDNEVWYKHCRPVRRDEVTFYEDRKDDKQKS